MKPITVLIVDDSILIRQMFSEMLSSEPGIEVVGTASDPLEAREKIKQLNPDVLTLDIEMPKMDGLSFLEKIMALRPMPVIMISSHTQKSADVTLRALELGAYDYISKPAARHTPETLAQLKDELISKVRSAAKARSSQRKIAQNAAAGPSVVSFHQPLGSSAMIIAMGSSTGGVEALREIFLRLPSNCPPIVIAQHMPETFTRSFAARLNGLSQVNVSEATHHARLKPGQAYVAPGNLHLRIMKVGADYVCKLEDTPPVSSHKPSVDVLFHSVADAAGSHAVGVILTGMGKDGAEGLKAMRDRGAHTIGQNEATCVIYGMPQVAVKLGAVETELPLTDIPAAILHICEKARA